MVKRNRRNNRRSRARRPGFLPFSDIITGWVTESATTSVLRKSLEIPTDRSFKITHVSLELVSEFSNGKGNTGIVQLRVYNPISTSSSVWTSGPILVGLSPVRKTWRIPSPMMWPVSTYTSAPVLALDGLCQGTSDKFTLRYVMKVRSAISIEQSGESCPKVIGPDLQDIEVLNP